MSLECWQANKLRRHLLILIVIFIPLDSVSAEWSFQPSVSLIAEYNDNKRLTTLPHDSVLGTKLDIKGKLGVETERAKINIIPRVRFSKYSGEENLDSNDYFLDLRSLLTTEKMYWYLNGKYVRDTSLVSELEDTGLVQTRKKREKVLLNPSFIYEFSERTNLNAAISFQQVEYTDAGLIGLVNYNFKTIDIAVLTETGDKGELNIALNVSRLKAADVYNQSDHVGLSIMHKRSLTDSMKGEVLFGVRESDFYLGKDGDKKGILFKLGINKEYEQAQLRAELSRTINPIGYGSMVQKDRFFIKVTRSMTDKLQALAKLSLLKQKGLEKSAINEDRRYNQFDVRLHWQVTDGWSMRGGYRYRYNESDRLLNAADSNAFVFEFIYRPSG